MSKQELEQAKKWDSLQKPTEHVQLRVTDAFKDTLLREAYQRRTTMTKLLIEAFWAFLENEDSK